jgi:hypothetical protein
VRFTRSRLIAVTIIAAAVLLTAPAANFCYRSSWGEGCARCHEIRANFDTWRHSSHRSVNCTECHTSSTQTNLRRVALHAGGEAPESIHLGLADVFAMVERCRSCHQQEFAQWRTGPHGATYARIFLDRDHNSKQRLIDDCLRCHGMHFPGSIQDLVLPISRSGPWKLKDTSLADRPAIPCLVCHSIHREGEPLLKSNPRIGGKQEIFRPSLSLMDRRSQLHLSLAYLPIPTVVEGSRPVKMSPDRRQALCYQCHSPQASRQAWTGDDRTPLGVHEGLSCLACHQKHGQQTRASCADCHPRLSNCGRDVEKMETTFRDPKSKHDIHSIKCIDCHPKGVPAKRRQILAGQIEVAFQR